MGWKKGLAIGAAFIVALIVCLGLTGYVWYSQITAFYKLTDAVLPAVEAGDLDKAKRDAERLLAQAASKKGDWNYGNAFHKGHLALGRIALARGDKNGAIAHLLEAGKTPGSPQLNSFGPNMTLAKELLAQGEKGATLRYFDECGVFWHDNKLAQWKQEIANGQTPDFGANLKY